MKFCSNSSTAPCFGGIGQFDGHTSRCVVVAGLITTTASADRKHRAGRTMMNSSRGRAVSPITGGTQNRRYCSWLARIVRHCSVTGADGGGAVLTLCRRRTSTATARSRSSTAAASSAAGLRKQNAALQQKLAEKDAAIAALRGSCHSLLPALRGVHILTCAYCHPISLCCSRTGSSSRCARRSHGRHGGEALCSSAGCRG